MNQQRIGAFLVVIVLSAHVVECLQVISTTTTLEIINGLPRHRTRATFQCTEGDAGIDSTFYVTDNSGINRTVTIRCDPPEYHYTQDLIGWVPKFMYPVITKICMTGVPKNNESQLFTDFLNVTTNPIGDLDDNSNGLARRRLLSVDRIGPPSKEESDVMNQLESNLKHVKFLRKGQKVDPYNKERYSDIVGIDASVYTPASYTPRPASRKLLTSWTNAAWDFVINNIWSLLAAAPVLKYTWPFTSRRWSRLKMRRSILKARDQDIANNRALEKSAPEEGVQIDPGEEIRNNDVIEQFQEENSADIVKTFGADATAEGIAEEGAAGFLADGAGMIAGGLAPLLAGFAISALLGGLFGGNNNNNKAIARALASIASTIDDIGQTLEIQQIWNEKQIEFDQGVQNEFSIQNRINQHLESQISQNTEAINNLIDGERQIANAISDVEAATVKGFTELGTQLEANANFTEEIWNATLDLHAGTESQIRQLANQVAKMSWTTQKIAIDLVHVHRQTSLRRAMTKLYHRTNSKIDYPQESVPFVEYPGTTPLNGSQLNATKTQAGAFSFGSVVIQRTIDDGSDYFAQAFNISVLCNPIFILDNIVQGLTLQTLFQWIGPENCTAATETEQWQCQCAVKIEAKECQLKSNLAADFYPWAWNTEGGDNSWFNPPGPSTFCAGSVTDITDPTHYDVEPDTVLTTAQDYYDWINGFCNSTLPVPNPTARGVSGAVVRLHGQFWPRFIDLELDLTNSTLNQTVCEGNFAAIQIDPYAHESLSYAIYHLQELNYFSNTELGLADLETEVYGRMPSGLTYEMSPFNSDARDQQTHQCNWFTYVRTNPNVECYDGVNPTNPMDISEQCDKVRVYQNIFAGRSGKLSVKVDGQEIMNRSAPVGSSEAKQRFSESFINSSTWASTEVTTDVQIDAEAEILLRGGFYRLGVHPGRTWTDGNMVMFDVPFNQINVEANPNSRMHYPTYMMQSARAFDEKDPINWKNWWAINVRNFDSRGVGLNPSDFMRQVINPAPDPFNDPFNFFCDKRYNVNGTIESNLTVNYDMCSLMRWFKIQPVNTGSGTEGQTGLIFRPRSYIVDGTLSVPGGSWTSVFSSRCPSAVQVINIDGDAQVIVNSSSAEADKVELIITNRAGNCTQIIPATLDAFQGPRNFGPFLYDPACGAKYLNIKTLDNGLLCYKDSPDPGIPLNVSHAIFGGNQANEITSAVAQVEDRAVRDIINQANAATDYALELQNISDTSKNDEEITKRVNEAYQKRSEQLEKANTNQRYSEQHVKEEIAKARQSADRAEQNAKNARKQADAVNKDIQQLQIEEKRNAYALSGLEYWEGQYNGSIKRDEAAIKRMNKVVDAAIKELNEDSSLCSSGGFMSFLTKPLCALFKWLEQGVGEIIKVILYVMVLLGGIVIMIVVFKHCISCCIHAASKHSSNGATVTVKESVPDVPPHEAPQPAHFHAETFVPPQGAPNPPPEPQKEPPSPPVVKEPSSELELQPLVPRNQEADQQILENLGPAGQLLLADECDVGGVYDSRGTKLRGY